MPNVSLRGSGGVVLQEPPGKGNIKAAVLAGPGYVSFFQKTGMAK